MARPRKSVDPKDVIQFASKGLTQEEIAASCGVSEDTIYRHYADAVKHGHKLMNASLRRRQYEVAMGGAHEKERANPTMLIWLGKQNLGQADKNETHIAGQFAHVHFDFASLSEQARLELRRAAELALSSGTVR